MLKCGTRKVERVSFNRLHDLILKNAKAHSLCHFPLYRAHVAHAMGSHTTTHYSAPPQRLVV